MAQHKATFDVKALDTALTTQPFDTAKFKPFVTKIAKAGKLAQRFIIDQNWHHTLLSYVASKQHLEAFKMVLNARADPNIMSLEASKKEHKESSVLDLILSWSKNEKPVINKIESALQLMQTHKANMKLINWTKPFAQFPQVIIAALKHGVSHATINTIPNAASALHEALQLLTTEILTAKGNVDYTLRLHSDTKVVLKEMLKAQKTKTQKDLAPVVEASAAEAIPETATVSAEVTNSEALLARGIPTANTDDTTTVSKASAELKKPKEESVHASPEFHTPEDSLYELPNAAATTVTVMSSREVEETTPPQQDSNIGSQIARALIAKLLENVLVLAKQQPDTNTSPEDIQDELSTASSQFDTAAESLSIGADVDSGTPSSANIIPPESVQVETDTTTSTTTSADSTSALLETVPIIISEEELRKQLLDEALVDDPNPLLTALEEFIEAMGDDPWVEEFEEDWREDGTYQPITSLENEIVALSEDEKEEEATVTATPLTTLVNETEDWTHVTFTPPIEEAHHVPAAGATSQEQPTDS